MESAERAKQFQVILKRQANANPGNETYKIIPAEMAFDGVIENEDDQGEVTSTEQVLFKRPVSSVEEARRILETEFGVKPNQIRT